MSAIIDSQMVGTDDNIRIRRRARQDEDKGTAVKKEDKAEENDEK